MIGADVTINGEAWKVAAKVGYSDQYVYLTKPGEVEGTQDIIVRPVAIVQAAILLEKGES